MKIDEFIQAAGLDKANFRWAFAFENEVNGEITDPEGADEILAYVLEGKKTATASALEDYEEDEPLPAVDGKFDVLLDGKGQPRAAISTSKVYITTFDKVTAEHAYKEGEGDRTLAYWRKVHQDFWSAYDLYRPDMPVVCEEFQVLYQI